MAWLKSFLTSVIVTTLMSVLIFVGTVSAITGKFPPDWQKLKATFIHAKKAISVSQKVMTQTDWEEMDQRLSAGQALNNSEGQTAPAPNTDVLKRVTELEIENSHLRTRLDELEDRIAKLSPQAASLPQPRK